MDKIRKQWYLYGLMAVLIAEYHRMGNKITSFFNTKSLPFASDYRLGNETKVLQQQTTYNDYGMNANGLGKRRPFSTHHCIGPRRMPEEERSYQFDLYRSCHFTDVCLAPQGHPLKSKADGHGFSLLYIASDDPDVEREMYNNPEAFKTMTKPQHSGHGPHRLRDKPYAYLIPRVVNQSTLAMYEKRWSPIPVAIPFRPQHCDNFGHSLGDNIFTMFSILRNFELYHPELRMLPLVIRDVKEADIRKCKTLSKLIDPFLQGVIDKPFHVTGTFESYYKSSITASTAGQKGREQNSSIPLLCFENLLSGVYFQTDHGDNPTRHGHVSGIFNTRLIASGNRLLEFRNQYMSRIGLDAYNFLQNRTCQVDAGNNLASIVIIPRRPKRGKESGWEEHLLVGELKKILPDEKVTVIDFSVHNVKAQVAMASTAKIIISMAGGGSYLTWFLPPGASALLLRRLGKSLDRYIYDNLPYIRTEFFAANNTKSTPELFDYELMAKAVHRHIKRHDSLFCDDSFESNN